MNRLRMSMMIGVLAAFIFCTTAFSFSDSSPNDLFNAGNVLYEQGKYEDAAGKYEEITKDGYYSGALYYNIGNCYFKLSSIGKALLYYERAKRLMPNDPELKFNYSYVQSLTEDKIIQPRKNWIERRLIGFAQLLSYSTWLKTCIALWFLIFISVLCGMFIQKIKHVFNNIAVLFFLCLIISVFLTAVQYSAFSAKSAIATAKETIVRYGPGEGEVEAFVLHEGAKAEVLKEEGDWMQIQLPDGKSGWLEKSTAEVI